jgi:hypothetical protein
MVVAFPAGMSQATIEAACRKIHGQSSGKIPPKLAAHILSAHGRLDVSGRLELLSDEQLQTLRADILEGVRAKAARPDGSDDPVKARKIFLSLGDAGKEIWGSAYAATKRRFDNESKGAVPKTGNQKEISK